MVIGAAWRRDCGLSPGDKVAAALAPEGPHRKDLPADIAGALAAEPAAAAFFDAVAPFYRKAYLTWADTNLRKPDVRAARVAQMVALLKAGEKERP